MQHCHSLAPYFLRKQRRVAHDFVVKDVGARSYHQRREKLRSMSSQYVDFEGMAKSVLGNHWRDLTAAQRDEFVPLFSEFIQDAYLSKMEQATVEKIRQEANAANVRFLKQTYFSSDYAEVFSTVTLRDQKDPLEINFMMHQDGGRAFWSPKWDKTATIADKR